MPKLDSLKTLSSYLRKKDYILLLVIAVIAIIIQNILNLLIPKIASSAIDQYQTTLTLSNTFYYLIAVIFVFTSCLSLLQNYFFSKLGEKIGTDLRNKLFKKVLKQDYNYLVKENPAKILTIILSDINYVKNTFTQALILAITSIILLLGSIFMMYSLNTKLATYIVISVPLLCFLLLYTLKNRFSIFQEVQKIRDKLNKIISENVKASMLVRVFVAEKTEVRKFKKQNKTSMSIGIKVTQLFAFIIPAISLLTYICSLLIIQVGGQEAMLGRLAIGDFSAFNLYVLIFTMPLVSIGFMSTSLGQAFASLERINSILYNKNTFQNGTLPLENINEIEIKNLSFTDDKAELLKGINFEIHKGEKVGIIGLTGSGKTLFLKHFIRAVDPTQGEIIINQKNIKDYKIEDIRKAIGFCFQDNFLINNSIYENIRFGREIDNKDIIKAAKSSEVTEFVKKFKRKYKTIVGEKGSTLSGGQKQRIMIARALASNPSLLILDDITSRLDANTEKKVLENIKRNYPDVSIILVSQKISSLTDCNHIYIFDNGEISEHGTHESLLKHSSLYKEIELAQSNYDE